MSLGAGALIAKIDIKLAYHIFPVCLTDRKWLGMKWQYRMLSFGLYSTPKIFNVIQGFVQGGAPPPHHPYNFQNYSVPNTRF